METELTYFLKEHLDYFSENDFMRHGFCEPSFSPKDDNKPGWNWSVIYSLFPIFIAL